MKTYISITIDFLILFAAAMLILSTLSTPLTARSVCQFLIGAIAASATIYALACRLANWKN